MRDMRTAQRLFLVTTILALVGCNANKLETGYEYRPLGVASKSQEKAFFANPFSPEARAAQFERAAGEGDRPGRGN
jgi:hypothetical protein